jgi:hypothetical protein
MNFHIALASPLGRGGKARRQSFHLNNSGACLDAIVLAHESPRLVWNLLEWAARAKARKKLQLNQSSLRKVSL